MQLLGNFTIHQIQLISQLSEALGIRDFARKNSMDPSAVTRLLQEIEQALGLKIATRTKKGLILTPEGHQVVELAKELVVQLSKFERLKKIDPAYAQIPTLNLGSRAFISTLLADVITLNPIEKTNLKFRFLDSSPSDLFKAALIGSIDIAVHFEKWVWPDTWQSESSATFTWGLVARANHPLKSKIKITDTQKYPFVGVSFLAGERVERSSDTFPLRWSDRKIGHEGQTAATAKAIIMNTNQLAFLPLITVANELDSGELKVLDVLDMKIVRMEVYLSVNKERVSNSALRIMKNSMLLLNQIDQRISGHLKGKVL
ncbi:MAG: LysR family transcriptional regulator [Bdellovibrionales bacterium]|nr:LysR family transcriptional regulator [Bdellovibrionales bacterium]